MEKTDQNKNRVNETTQTTQWINDMCSAATNMYSQQLKTATDFYNTLYQSMPKPEGSGLSSSFYGENEPLKAMLKTFNLFESNTGMLNNLLAQLEDIYKQMGNFNKNLFDILQEEFKNKPDNWNNVKEKYY